MPNVTGRTRYHRILDFLGTYSVLLGLYLRLFLAWALPKLLDGGPVPYTDIDFFVFSDASQYIRQGLSPYNRHTYRYTPFLAAALARLPNYESGRMLFCIADALCGGLILQFRKSQREKQGLVTTINDRIFDSLWWLYNPLAINICTRGSSESLQVLLPVLLTIQIVYTNMFHPWLQAALAGILHGIAIHSKLYPMIYSLSYMAFFATRKQNQTLVRPFPWRNPMGFLRLIRTWVLRLLQPSPLIFLLTSLSTFGTLTFLSVKLYGEEALSEGLLYHFSRVDHRHNYSMYWYLIYLVRARSTESLQWMGRLLLLPQVTLLAYCSLGIAPQNLGLALFSQTFLFVTHNKVITAQYFTWYLCLLPLCSDSIVWTSRLRNACGLLLVSILGWLGSAFCLEMQGMAVHRLVWVASLGYYFANINLFGAILRSSRPILDMQRTYVAKKSL